MALDKETDLEAGFRGEAKLLIAAMKRNGELPENAEAALLQTMAAFAAVEENRETSGSVCVSFDDWEKAGVLSSDALTDILTASGAAVPMETASGNLAAAPGTPLYFAPFVIDEPGERLYVQRRFAEEMRLARAVIDYTGSATDDPGEGAEDALEKFREADERTGRMDPDHDDAVDLALRHRLTVITGGPGTGKTTVVARILASLLADNEGLVIAGAAPTGKAASNLDESILGAIRWMESDPELEDYAEMLYEAKIQSKTLHRLILEPVNGKRLSRDYPLPADVLVVDECSMMDIDLADRLFSILDPRRTRLILLGDKDQLSAVGPGAVFSDLSDGRGALSPWISAFTSSHRFSMTSNIYRLSRAITPEDGSRAKVSRILEILRQGAVTDADNPIVWHEEQKLRYGALVTEELAAWLEREFSFLLKPGAADHFPAVPSGDPEDDKALAAFWTMADAVRVLAAIHAGTNGTDAVNEWMETRVKRAVKADPLAVHYPGRFIMVRRNDTALGLANGDVAVELLGEAGGIVAWFGNRRKALPAALLPEHETAYAITIHKSQGSSYPRLAVTLPDGNEGAGSRELLYTAVTRLSNGREKKGELTLFATEKAVKRAVMHEVKRSGGLASRLNDFLLLKYKDIAG